MLEQRLKQIQPGMNVCDPHGHLVGRVVEVRPEPPEGGYSSGFGYIHVEGELRHRKVDLRVPFNDVREVKPDCVVITLER